jgi:hypothetical protein
MLVLGRSQLFVYLFILLIYLISDVRMTSILMSTVPSSINKLNLYVDLNCYLGRRMGS